MSIWKYSQLNHLISEQFRLSLNEGDTPLEQVDILGQQIYLKREDLNPNKSFKDRSLAFQISHYYEQGVKNLVISSSGNAAISAASYCALAHINLDIFVSENMPLHKQKALNHIVEANSELIKVHSSKNAKSDAFKYARENNYVNLRGSTDDSAIVGFSTIAYELAQQLPNIDAVFICCSSGTSTVGIYNGFNELHEKGEISKIPQIHIVQSTKIHPIAEVFDKDFISTEKSLADAISDRVANRKTEILKLVVSTGGSGWVVDDNEIRYARFNLHKVGTRTEGFNGYVATAGYIRALSRGWSAGNVVCINSGL